MLCSEIRRRLENRDLETEIELDGSVRVMKGEIERILLALKDEYKSYWINDHRKMESTELADLLCQHLEEWGFGQWEDKLVFIFKAACGRWHVQYGSVELEE